MSRERNLLPVATVLGCDPYDERTGIRLTPDDWRRLNALPKGTLLYAKEPAPQPEAEPARKIGGSYQANGFIVARFKTIAGLERVVFEFTEPKGMLHIFSTDQIEPVTQQMPAKQRSDSDAGSLSAAKSGPDVCPHCKSRNRAFRDTVEYVWGSRDPCESTWHNRQHTDGAALDKLEAK